MPNQNGITVPAVPVANYPLVNSVDVLCGQQSVTASTGATTLVTIPIGRTWTGQIGANCAGSNTGAVTTQGQARAVFTTAGGTAIPAAGTYFVVEALWGANVAAGTVGTSDSTFGMAQFTVVAGSSAATIQVTTTIAGTIGHCDSFAIGQLQ